MIITMLDIQPHVTYSPEGVLTIRTNFEQNLAALRRRERVLGRLDDQNGVSVDDDGSIHTDVAAALGDHFGDYESPELYDYLSDVGKVSTDIRTDARDRVLSANYLNPYGFKAAVYPHFQRWLNTQVTLDETVARETLTAMAAPFGPPNEFRDAPDIKIRNHQAKAGLFALILSSEEFKVRSVDDTDEELLDERATVHWNSVSLTTYGSETDIGLTPVDRERVRVTPAWNQTRLYEMKPRDVYFPVQTLSLLLGVGVLAYRAARYEGREDILDGAHWHDLRP